ncbi:unnamed protein product [Rotaria sp. Silwood1]|nr:unnamed protein product [Rotaria sp. Silwood1]
MNPSSSYPPSRNEFDQYLGRSSSSGGKQFDNTDDLVAWIYQHAQTLQNGSNDPVMKFCSDSSNPMSLLPVVRSLEPPIFDQANVDNDAVTKMFDRNQDSNAYAQSELIYDVISDINCDFGLVEMADCIPTIPTPTPDFDLSPSSPPMKKPRKRKQDRVRSNLPQTNVREWYVMDGITGRQRRPLLHEFLRQLLDNPNYSYVAAYVDKRKGIFKFYEKSTAAELWQHVKGRNSDRVMTYDKLARAIRYYYSTGIIRPTPGRFTFEFGIILAFNKRSPIEIAQAIKNFDFEMISIELVQHLIQYIPNDIEIDAFRHLSIDKEKLPPTDRLMYEIIQIPFYTDRLNTLKFKLIFADNYHLLKDQMHLINEASCFLYQSKHIKKLLEIILSVVNHLNPTATQRILTLDDLSKICDLKTSKTRIPIMSIVSEICNDHHSEIFGLKQNYKLILSASKIDLDLIKSGIDEIKQEFEQIQLCINKFEENIEIQKFVSNCQETLHEIVRYYQITNDQFHKTLSYFTKEITPSTRLTNSITGLLFTGIGIGIAAFFMKKFKKNKPNVYARARKPAPRRERPFSPTELNSLDDSFSGTTGTGLVGKYDTRVISAASADDIGVSDPNEIFAQATLQAINGFRRRYEAQPLELNDQLSEIAQRWAEQMASTGKLEHSPAEWRNLGRQTLGENYAASFQAELTGEKMVRKWMKEGKRYMFGYDGRKDTENFTQLVWRASREIGVGRARSDDGNWWYGVVIFDPPGNIPNQYADNVHLPAEIK